MLGGSVEGQGGLASHPCSTSAFLHTELLRFDGVIASYSSVEFITVWGGIYGWERLGGCHFALIYLEKGAQIMSASLLMIVWLVNQVYVPLCCSPPLNLIIRYIYRPHAIHSYRVKLQHQKKQTIPVD